MQPAGRTLRKMRASWRETALLLGGYRHPLLLFAVAIMDSGWFSCLLSINTFDQAACMVHGISIARVRTICQIAVQYAQQWYLQIFFFTLAIISLDLLAQPQTEFGERSSHRDCVYPIRANHRCIWRARSDPRLSA